MHRVADTPEGTRVLMHGTTLHGTQAIDPAHKMTRLSYYSKHSGLSDAMDIADGFDPPQNVAVLGLGIGVTACYTHEGRRFDFFEIDPGVIKIATDKNLFTFLSGCGSPYEIIPGDARLTLEERPDNSYDVIIIDVFSSDNIPMHLLTVEALEMYKQKLTKRGFITANISNRYLDLKPVFAKAAQRLSMHALYKQTEGGKMENSGLPYTAAEFVVLTPHASHLRTLQDKGWKRLKPEADFRVWTDDFSNLLSVFEVFR